VSAPAGYTLSFQSKFDTPNYVPIANNWDLLPPFVLGKAWVPQFLGHTPNAEDFGDAYFTTPADSSGHSSPWWVGWGQLICSPYKDNTGHWRSGIISTADTRGDGFTAALGYWEASFTVPNQSGIWPSFWLNDVMDIPYLNEKSRGVHYEIDVCELYGPNHSVGLESGWQVNQHLHIWAPSGAQVGGADHVYVAPKTWCGTTSSSFQSGAHVYGVLITAATITFFMDGVKTFSTPSPADIANHKFFAMIDYAMGSGYPDPVPPCNPMWIQYLRYYAPPA
jgi:beta-glucanase (GH16 family)